MLALTILPRVLRERAPAELLRFESAYERIGMPALLAQVATGLWMAQRMLPDMSRWFALHNPISRLVGAKLLLLAITVALAADARLRVIPKLSEKNLTDLAWHIIRVTAVSVLFVVGGVSFRAGSLR